MSRPLAEVILELQRVHSCCEDAYKALETAQRENNKNVAAEVDDEISGIENELDDLREEFRATFKELTGVAWSNVEAAQMSGAL